MNINNIPMDMMLEIYSYVGPKLLYVNNHLLLKKILNIKRYFKEHGICIFYQIRKIITNTDDEYYKPVYEYMNETNKRIYGNMDIGTITNTNRLQSSKYFNRLLPKKSWEMRFPKLYNSNFKESSYEYTYIRVDNIDDFRNYQLVWKKY
mgnify:CR=1 FL=1|tara:strand:+ start:805 stop:1251 length:447 start_codon:yes stop_codon:yes gene_type:complete